MKIFLQKSFRKNFAVFLLSVSLESDSCYQADKCVNRPLACFVDNILSNEMVSGGSKHLCGEKTLGATEQIDDGSPAVQQPVELAAVTRHPVSPIFVLKQRPFLVKLLL